MFAYCGGNITSAPALPATQLAKNCYNMMFYNCYSITTAPDLPAETLVEGCYYWMFAACYAINYIKCLATDISATNCTTNWTSSVASTGTFVRAAAMTSWTRGINGIPNNWTEETA